MLNVNEKSELVTKMVAMILPTLGKEQKGTDPVHVRLISAHRLFMYVKIGFSYYYVGAFSSQ